MSKLMDFNIGDKIKFVKDSAGGKIKKGTTGIIKDDFSDAVMIKLKDVVGSYKKSTYYLSFVGPDADNIKVVGYDSDINKDKKSIVDDIRGENKAIDQYQDHINATNDPEVKSKLKEIQKEEEHHAKELTEILSRKCPK